MIRVYHVVGIGLLVFGVVMSVREYQGWRYAELKNYGQGVEVSEVVRLGEVFQSEGLKVRMRFPVGWEVREKNGAIGFVGNGCEGKVIRVKQETGVLADLVAAQVEKVGKLDREWEYVNGEKFGFTVVTWSGNGKMFQRAMGLGQGSLVTIEIECESDEFRVMNEVYKSVVIF
jgi:hypothetical protein